jgi:hypothetical protein
LVVLERAVRGELQAGGELLAHKSPLAFPVAFLCVAQVFEARELGGGFAARPVEIQPAAGELPALLFNRALAILDAQLGLLQRRAAQFQPDGVVVAFNAPLALPRRELVRVQPALHPQHLLRREALADVLIV